MSEAALAPTALYDDPDQIRKFADYLAEDTRAPSPYLFERAQHEPSTLRLPVSRYIDPAYAVLEVERMWKKVWQVACRENDIPHVGDFVEYEIANSSILVVRDRDLRPKAFYNACRHRGMQVAKGCGHATGGFSCPFHAWRYRLDGSLAAIPAAWDFPGVDRASSGLEPVRVDSHDGYIYVNLDPGAEPLADYLGERVRTHLEVAPDADMVKVAHYGIVINCNWKVIMEAFMETYHIAATHPTLRPCTGDLQAQYDFFGRHARFLDPNGVPALAGGAEFTQAETLGSMLGLAAMAGVHESQKSNAGEVHARPDYAAGIRNRLAAKGIDLDRISDAEITDSIVYQLFPNFFLFRNPAGKVNYRFRPCRGDAERSVYELMVLQPVAPGAERPKDVPLHMLKEGETFDDYAETLGVVGFLIDEDVQNCERIQRGLHSLEHIQLARSQEANIAHFHDNIEGYLAS